MKIVKEYLFWILAGIAVLVFVGFAIANSEKGSVALKDSGGGGSSELVEFAQCLEEEGAVFYGASWCSYCNAQKQEFAGAADSLPYVECALGGGQAQTPACEQAGIEAYPTWTFADGSRQTGVLSFEVLAAKTGCAAPQI